MGQVHINTLTISEGWVKTLRDYFKFFKERESTNEKREDSRVMNFFLFIYI